MIQQRVRMQRAENAQGKRRQESQGKAGQGKNRRAAKPSDQFARHGKTVLVGYAQVAPQGVQRPVAVLDQKRPVQAHAFPCFLEHLFRHRHALRVELFRGSIARGQIHQQKGQKADGNHDKDQMQHPFSDVFQHGSVPSFPIFFLCRQAISVSALTP